MGPRYSEHPAPFIPPDRIGVAHKATSGDGNGVRAMPSIAFEHLDDAASALPRACPRSDIGRVLQSGGGHT